jgi:hypothetical protein
MRQSAAPSWHIDHGNNADERQKFPRYRELPIEKLTKAQREVRRAWFSMRFSHMM